MLNRNITFALALALLLGGCVSQKQYDGLWSQKAALEVDKTKLQDQLADLQSEKEALEAELSDLE